MGMASIVPWVLRRRDGVPPGATAVPYAREQTPTLLIVVFLMALEAGAVEVLLRAWDVPAALRLAVLAVDLYSVVIGLAIAAACATRPHVVSPTELRIRYGVFFDLRLRRETITSVRPMRAYDESGVVTVKDGRLGVAVSSQTNIIVELAEPVTVTRPLGRRADVTQIRFFADDPAAALAALRTRQPR
ncbi:hypothetical protein GCM10023193_65120 [Planotetraspora kaengkrachanensis]|uniref:PH domain-containing protein n=2 Tax=Planotetraspora kaengkrachanensis TaxID=575193 RepID=A0A8J3V9Y9_9ACTN|nr:hypothetical protein Pka01_60300 [Planotetraspora kaengkrachanensis]